MRGIRIRCRRIFIHKQWSKHRNPGTRGTILLLRHHFAGRELQQISSYHFTFNLWPQRYTALEKICKFDPIKKNERFDVKNILKSFFSHTTMSVFGISLEQSFFFSFSLVFSCFTSMTVSVVIIIAYFDYQYIIITTTITTITTSRLLGRTKQR